MIVRCFKTSDTIYQIHLFIVLTQTIQMKSNLSGEMLNSQTHHVCKMSVIQNNFNSKQTTGWSY